MTSTTQRSLLAGLTALLVIGLTVFLIGRRLALEARRRDGLLLDAIANIGGELERLESGLDEIRARTGVARNRLRQLVALHRESLMVCARMLDERRRDRPSGERRGR